MLKNFITTLVMIGALWSTPLSFVFQGTPAVGVQVADARLGATGAAAVKPATPPPEEDSTIQAFGLDCIGWTHVNIDDCLAMVSYYIFYAPSGLILILGGGIFDAFLAFSVSPLLLNQDFVSSSWATIRDIANLVFILVLLWIAIATILNIGGVQLKQAVASVIIIALLINFSMFFTRVVIDASNVVAMEFYSAVGAGASAGNHIKGVEEKRISEKIMSSLNPQALLSPNAFEKWKKGTNSSNAALIFLFFAAAVINLCVAYVLLYAGFLLVGRVIAFVFLIIASPLAFIAYALPKGGGFTGSWWNQLLSQAMVAPVFLFFLYIIVQIIAGMDEMIPFNGAQAATGSSFVDLFITVALKAAIVVVALFIALSKAKSLSGEAGKWATKAGTVAVGAALGTTAFAGRRLIGGGARALADSDRFKRFAARTGVVGEVADRGLRATSSGTMDIRGIPGMDKAGFGKAGGKGGYDKHLSEKVKRKEDFGKRLKGVTRTEEGERKEINPETGRYRINELRGETPKEGINPATGRTFKYEHEQKIREQEGKDRAGEKIDVQEEYTSRLEKRGGRPWAQANRQAAKNLRKKLSPEEEFLQKMRQQERDKIKAEGEAEAPKEEPPKEGAPKS